MVLFEQIWLAPTTRANDSRVTLVWPDLVPFLFDTCDHYRTTLPKQVLEHEIESGEYVRLGRGSMTEEYE